MIELNGGDKFNSLTYKGSSKLFRRFEKVQFTCDCGNIKNIVLTNVIRRKTKTCGECNKIILKNGFKHKSLTYFGPDLHIHPKSHQKILFSCKCGSKKLIPLNEIKKRKSCGECNKILLRKGHRFGNLTYSGPDVYVFPMSTFSIEVDCGCGNVCKKQLQYLFGAKAVRCGSCSQRAKLWFDQNKPIIKNSFHPNELPIGGPKYISGFKNQSSPYKSECLACGTLYYPRLRDIKTGRSITCGCSNNKISSLCYDIYKFLSLYQNVDLEHEVDNCKFDLHINGLLIEINGLKWHSFEHSKLRDLKKFEVAKQNGYNYLMIFEDELILKKELILQVILNKLNLFTDSRRIRPSKCIIKQVGFSDVSSFYDKHHYIGATRAIVHYGVYYHDLLIAAASFGRPTRQTSKHDYELVRMSSHPEYRVHGIWSKLMKKFIEENEISSMISFSDNRLFSGGVYEKMGFKLDGEIPPDYYWVKGRKRFHKSGLRKTKEEKLSGKTETQLRIEQGYSKIWDLGKKRWLYTI
jgi:LSD1 subclass zinc finger protein